jgi:hypothetical protein
MQYVVVDASLKHEFKCHKVTKMNLVHERNMTRELIEMINHFEISKVLKSNLLSDDFQLEVLFRKNQDMRQKLYDYAQEIESLNYTLEHKENCIKQLKNEKKRAIEKLEEGI